MAHADILSTNFRFKVSKIKDLNVIWTPEFIVQGIPWKVQVSKRVIEGNSSLAIFFHCAKNDKSLNWSHEASSSFKLLPFTANANAIEYHNEPHVFDNSGIGYGFSSFIEWNDLFDEKKSYVKDDAINLEVEINAADPNEATKSSLICTTIEKCCDEGCLATFRLTVTNFEQLMAVRSQQLILRNIVWYLTVLKSRSGYISVRLESIKTPNDFSCNVRMFCKLISTNEGAQKIEQTKADILKRSEFLLCNYFVSLDELLKPQNGYVENDSVVIEVELKMDKPEGILGNTKTNISDDGKKLLKIECAICFESVRDKEVSSVKCGHMFCTICITRALETREKCPKCNALTNLKDLRRIYIDNLN